MKLWTSEKIKIPNFGHRSEFRHRSGASLMQVQGTSRFLAQGGGAMPPFGFAKGGHFKVKEGHPDFLQI